MSLIVIDDDPWITEYELCEKVYHEIIDLLNKRSVEFRSSETYARLSSSARIRLNHFDTEVLQLRSKLRDLTLSRTIDEAERRERLIEKLQTNSIKLQNRFNDRDLMSKTNRSEKSDNRNYNDYILPVESTVSDIDHFRKLQNQMLKQQDKGLENLSKTISRQKNIAIQIGTEVESQSGIIDDISDRIERTNIGLQNGTEQIVHVSRSDSTCYYWLLIIGLFVAILFIWF